MGAWGAGSWDNDDACDWVYELEETKNLDFIIETLQAVTNPEMDYLENTVCCEALAAAEVVAAANGKPGNDLPEEVQTWLGQIHPKIDSDTIKLAHRVVKIITQKSELLELWQESSNYSEWQAAISNLKGRLREGTQS
jgi:hypothetical protein